MKHGAILQIFFAIVWLTNGLWAKLLGGVPRHQEIVSRILGAEYSLAITRLIGGAEIIMAAWIVSGLWRRWSAAAQITTVLTMNVIEFALARDLLLFGGWNSLIALVYCALVACAEVIETRLKETRV